MSILPSAAAESDGPTVAEAAPILASVLVIDDEEIVRWTLDRLLKAEGYDVVTATSGEEGVELLRHRQFEVAITDLMMPGMDGLHAIAALKEVDQDIEVVVLTGYATVDSTVAALRAGACDYLIKPFEKELLLPALTRAFARRRPKAALPLYEASRTLLANLDRDDLFPSILELSQQMMRAGAAALVLVPGEGGEPILKLSKNAGPLNEASVLGLTRRAFEACGPLCNFSFPPDQNAPAIPPGSVLAYPLTVRNAKLGALVLWRDPSAAPFSAFDVERGKLLVDEISIAVDNARLYRQLTQKVREVETARGETAQAEARARAVIETAREAIVLFDREGVIRDFNPVAEEAFGLTREQALGKNLADFAIPACLTDVFKLHLETAYRTGRDPLHGSMEVLALRKNGKEFPFEISTAAIETPQGRFLSTFGRDVTERRCAENALLESEAKLQAIFNGVKTGILVIDPETHRIVDANPLALELVGAPREMVVGAVCHKFVCPAERGRCPVTDLGQVVDESERVLLTATGDKRSIIKTVRPVVIGGRNLLIESIVDITARKNAEQALAAAEEHFRSLFASIPLPTFFFDAETLQYLEVNDAAVANTGYSRDEFLRMTVTDLVLPEFTALIVSKIHTLHADSRERSEGTYRLKDGRSVDVEVDFRALDFRGRKAVLAVTQDVTARKQAEEALHESEDRYRDLVENSFLLIGTHDAKARLLSLNRAAAHFLEMTNAEESAGRSLSEFVPPELLPKFGQYLETVLREGHAEGLMVLLTPSGKRKIVEYTNTVRRQRGKEPIIRWAGQDVTERIQAEEALRASENRYRLLFERNLAGVLRTTQAGRVLECNESMARMLGYQSGRELVGTDIRQVWDIPAQREEMSVSLGKRQSLINFEVRFRRKDGQHGWALLNIHQSGVQEGEAPTLESTVIDITDRRRAQDELDQSRQMLQSILDALPQRVFWKDRNLFYLGCNRAFALDAGFQSPAEVIGKSDFELAWRESAKHYRATDSEVIEREFARLNLEERQSRPDNSLLWLRTNKIPFRNAEGTVIGVIGTYEDITDHKRAEEDLSFKTALLEAEAECTIDGILVVNRAGQVLQCNKRFVEMMGLHLDTITLTDDAKILGHVVQQAKDPGAFLQRVKYLYAHETEKAQDEIEFQDERVFDRYSSPLNDASGGYYGRVWYFRDITERKRAEKALRESEERFRRIAETITEVFWTASADISRMLYISPGYEQVWGRTVASLYENPRSFLESIHPEDVDRVLSDLGAHHQREPFNHEYRILKPDGAVRWIWDRGFPVRDEAGGINCYVGVAQDITDRKLAEEALRESELRIRRLTESNIVGIFVRNDQGGILEANSALLQMLDYTERELRDGSIQWGRLTPPEHLSASERIRHQLLSSGVSSPVEIEFFRRDGSRIPAMLGLVALDASATRALGIVLDLTDRQQAERALEERTVYLNTLFETSPLGIVVLDTMGRIQMSNSAFERLFLYSRQEIAGAKLDDFIVPEGLTSEAKSLTGLCLTGPGASLTSSRRRKDGSMVDVDIYGVPLFIEGELRGVLTLYQDITERKRAEAELVRYAEDLEVSKAAQEEHAEELARLVEELGRERDLLGTVMDNIPDGIYYKDRQSRFLRVNLVAAKTYGLSDPRAAIGRTDFDFFPEQDARAYFRDEQKVIETGQPLIGQIEKVRQPDGQYRWHSTSTVPIRDTLSRVTGLVGITRDMTERLQAEERLKASEERYRELFENASDIVYTTGLDTCLTSLNQVGQQFLGYSEEEATRLDLLQLVAPRHWEIVRRGRDRLRAGESDLTMEVEVIRKDGRSATLEVKPRVIYKSGAPVGVQGIARDITGRDEAEMELRHAQKLESVGRLAAGIAHEINTPIQFVGDNTRFLQDSFGGLQALLAKYRELRDAADSGSVNAALVAEVRRQEEEADCDYMLEEIPRALSQTLDGVTRVATIVRAMKEFAHPEGKEMAAANLNRALQSTLTVARNELKYVAEVETDFGELPPVVCNVGDLNQVFLNLLVNAAHAISEATKEQGERGKIRVHTRCEEKSVLVSISDTGAGIPEAIRGRIFDPFFTTKEVGRGTGQGLAIARSVVVDRHKGALTFESEVGKGTTFYIRLPLDPAYQEEANAS